MDTLYKSADAEFGDFEIFKSNNDANLIFLRFCDENLAFLRFLKILSQIQAKFHKFKANSKFADLPAKFIISKNLRL